MAPLDRHLLERLSHLFGIYAALQILFPVPRAPTSGSGSPTRRRSSAAARRSTACSAARSPTSSSCASTSTRSAAARRERSGRPGTWRSIRRRADRARVWKPSYRLIPSRYPTVGLYDAIADPADLDVVFAIEALANPRMRDELGEVQLVPPEERVSGPGATPIMAAFTHLNPEGSRFSDGSYGVYYAAHSLETAIAEVSHHRAVFLRRTAEPAIDIDLRLITATVEAELHDLRGADAAAPHEGRFAAVLDPDDYGASQRLGRRRCASAELGPALAERAPCRRRVRRHLPAARAAPRQGGAAPRAALGRRAHQPLVREAGAARRQRLTAARAARGSSPQARVSLQLREFFARVARSCRGVAAQGARATVRIAPQSAAIRRPTWRPAAPGIGWHAPCVPPAHVLHAHRLPSPAGGLDGARCDRRHRPAAACPSWRRTACASRRPTSSSPAS